MPITSAPPPGRTNSPPVSFPLLSSRCGEGGRTHADAGGFHRLAGVVRNHVFVDDDARLLEQSSTAAPGEIGVFRAQVDEHQVVIGATADKTVAATE